MGFNYIYLTESEGDFLANSIILLYISLYVPFPSFLTNPLVSL